MTIVISVESIIGAGKTELLNLFKDDPNVCCIYEPVDEWSKIGILKEFYDALQDKNERVISLTSYKFQTFTFITRIKKILEQYKQKPDAQVYLLERSIFADRYFFVEMLYESKYFSEREYKMYQEWWELWKVILPFKINGFIYLIPSIDETMDRLKKRNRDGETSVSVLYQENLKKYHEKFLQNIIKLDDDYYVKCLRIDTTHINYKDDIKDKIYIKTIINEFIDTFKN